MDELFDLPAGVPVAARAPRPGTPRLSRPVRNQVMIRVEELDALLPPDHLARVIWAYVEGLDLSPWTDRIRSLEGGVGRPAIDPAILAALWLYATADEVGSARALERLCDEQAPYRWICGGVSVNYHTLADFRVADPEALDGLLVAGVAALGTEGLVALGSVAQDGMRVRAAAGRRSYRGRARLEAIVADAEARVARLRTELADDPSATSRRAAAARERGAREVAERARRALATLPGIVAQKAKRTYSGKRDLPPAASTTDSEARFMKMPDGGVRPALNVEFATTTADQIVVGVAVVPGIDSDQLAPMAAGLRARYGENVFSEYLVDGGFANLEAITDLAACGTTVICPVPKPRAGTTRDPHAPRPGDSPAVAAWRIRMGTPEAKLRYRLRASTAECVNAQARNRGLQRFRVRGLRKTLAVALWYALVQNLVRGISLRAARATAPAAG